MKTSKLPFLMILAMVLTLASCSNDDFIGGSDDGDPGDDQGDTDEFVGAVYAMTNGEGQIVGSNVQGPNTIIAYGRDANGELTPNKRDAPWGMGRSLELFFGRSKKSQ